VRGSQSRHQAPSQSDAWNPASSKAASDAAWATMQLWSPVSGSDRHSVVHRKVNDGSAARPRGKRGWRGRRSRWARAHDRSCGRSRTTTSKPERATPRETGALHRPDSRGDPKPPERNDVGPRVAAAKSRDRGHSPSASIRKKRRDVHDVARRSARNRTNPFKAGASRFRIVRGRVRHPAHGPIVVRRSVDASASRASSREAPLRCHRSMEDVPDRTQAASQDDAWKHCSPFTGRVEAAVSTGRATTLRVQKTRWGASSDG